MPEAPMSTTRSLHHDRRGVTLVTSLLLVMLLTISIIAAFTRITADRRTTLDSSGALDAYAIAQNGVDRFLTLRTAEPTTFPDSTTFDVAGGRAAVVLRRIRQKTANLPAMYLITSTGWSTQNRYDPRAPRATRRVAQVVQWSEATLAGGAALTSLNGIDQQGQPATYDGRNGCSASDASTWKPGLQMLDASDFEKSGNQNPPQIYGSNGNAIVDMGNLQQALASLGFSWNTVLQSINNVPNVVHVPPVNNTDDFNNFNFPNQNVKPWPVIVVDNQNAGTYTTNQAGHGILIVTGDFATSGNAFGWEGLVLVGGKLTVNGNSTWEGSVFAGLNNNDPNNPSVVMPDNLINGQKTFLYNSCSIADALSGFAGWAKLGNARADNVPTYN
jgi:Tfp pilus assembly protein PilV